MQFERLGVVVFFGILIPGAYLMVFLILAFACVLELIGIQGHAEIFSFMSQHSLLSSTVFFSISYLFGGIMWSFSAPTIVDKISAFYLRVIRQKKETWVDERFPYKQTMNSSMERAGMADVPRLVEKLNTQYYKTTSGRFFNYCKLFIEANNETLAKHVRQNESLVRFLAGTVLALIVSCIVGFLFSLVFFIRHQFLFALIYIALTLVSLVVLVAILSRFKPLRQIEVSNLWMSLHLLLKGGVSNALNITPDELQKRITMEGPPISEFPGNSESSYSSQMRKTSSVERQKSSEQTEEPMPRDLQSNTAEYTIHLAKKWSATDFTTFLMAIRNIYTIFMAQDDNVEEVERKNPEKALRIKQITYASPGSIVAEGLAAPIHATQQLIESFVLLPLKWKDKQLDLEHKKVMQKIEQVQKVQELQEREVERAQKVLKFVKDHHELRKELDLTKEQFDNLLAEPLGQNLSSISYLVDDKKLLLPAQEGEELLPPKSQEVLKS